MPQAPVGVPAQMQGQHVFPLSVPALPATAAAIVLCRLILAMELPANHLSLTKYVTVVAHAYVPIIAVAPVVARPYRRNVMAACAVNRRDVLRLQLLPVGQL